MLYIVHGARVSTPKKQGDRVFADVHVTKGKKSSQEGFVGSEVATYGCDPTLASEIRNVLTKNNGHPVVYDLTPDTQGGGQYLRIVIIDGTFVGTLTQFDIVDGNLTKRQAKPAA